ncbi:MAG TPA: hypothetical protein DEB39_14570 [Planctomycetaceae bacterium]|nr:hypothetical protein [Planctomycetaceae bacterium]
MTKTERRILTEKVALEIREEMERAENLYGPFHSLHEALAVIREEYLELEQAIFWGNKNGNNKATVRLEALQVAAMATRLLMMLTPSPNVRLALSDAEEEID